MFTTLQVVCLHLKSNLVSIIIIIVIARWYTMHVCDSCCNASKEEHTTT